MKRNEPSRRELLRALGVSAMAAPLVPTLHRQAEATGFPQRLLLLMTPCGAIPTQYWPDGSETNFSFRPGSILEPLTPHRQDLIIPKDLKRTFDSLGGDHERGVGGLWTGAKLNPGDQASGAGWPSGPSIDQMIAKALPNETRFRSLEIGVQTDGAPEGKSEVMRYMSFAAANQPVTPENSPYKLFDRLVGAGTGRTAAELAAIRARRQSVIDTVRAELGDLSKKLGKSEQTKVDGHLEALRAIESRLQKGGDEKVACGGTKPNGMIDLQANDNFPTILKMQTDLVVSALACDASRVIAYEWTREYSQIRHTWAGVTGAHHAVSHDGSAEGEKMNVLINRFYAERFAYLLSEMKKIPEGNGTLLDNTLVVMAPTLAHGETHAPNPGLAVLAGKLGGKFKTGRFIDYKQNANWTQLLVTICQAMGHKVDTVGNLGPGGVIPGLMAG